MARFLEPSEQDDQQGRQHVLDTAYLAIGHAVVEPVRDRRFVRSAAEPFNHVPDNFTDLRRGGVAFLVRLGVDQAGRCGMGQAVEPALEPNGTDVGEPEPIRDAAHADRFEIVGQQVDVCSPGQLIQASTGRRPHSGVHGRFESTRAQRRGDHSPQLAVLLPLRAQQYAIVGGARAPRKCSASSAIL